MLDVQIVAISYGLISGIFRGESWDINGTKITMITEH